MCAEHFAPPNFDLYNVHCTCDTTYCHAHERSIRERKDSLAVATMSHDPNLPFCCTECAQLYTLTYYRQSLETFLLSQNHDSLGEEKLENNTDVYPITPTYVNTGSSKSVSRGPRHIPESERLNVSRNNHDDPSVPTRSPTRRNPRKFSELENGIGLTSSVPAQDPSSSSRAHNRQNLRQSGISNTASKFWECNDDIPPIPGAYPQETRGSYSVDKPQAHAEPLSIPSVLTDERNQSKRPQTQQPRETRVSFSANKPRDSDHVEPPVPIQEKSQSNFSQTHSQSQETQASNKPRDHVEPPPVVVPIQGESQPDFSQTHAQSQETQASNKPRDHVEPPSVVAPIQENSHPNFSQTYSQSQETQASNKPRDHVEPPSVVVPIQEKSQPNFSQTQFQETQTSNKPRDHVEPPVVVPIQEKSQPNVSQTQSQETQADHVEPSSVVVPIQEKSRSNFSQTHFQPQETQTSNVNKSQDRAERPKTSIPAQDEGQGRSASDASKADTRPHLMHGTPSQMDTQYVNMLLALDDIPTLYNLLAKFFNWILLAGFILFPGTFTSLKNLGGSGQVEQQLVKAVTSIPL